MYFLAVVSPYHGPGAYGRTAILSGGGVSIVVGSKRYNPLAAGATASVTVHANGSGKFTFRNAAPTNPARPALSGAISWKCSG